MCSRCRPSRFGNIEMTMKCSLMRICCVVVVVVTCSSLGICEALPPARTGDFYVSDFGNDRIAVFDGAGV